VKWAVVNTLWKRRWLSKLTLRRVRNAAPPGTRLVAAVSDPKDAFLATAEGWHPVTVQNQPLGRKHNAAMRACRGADAVVVVGSDNWLCDKFFEVMEPALEHANLLGVLDVYAVCSYNRLCAHFGGYAGRKREGDSLGVGRVLSGDLLERLDWRPWEDRLATGLDASMQRKLREIAEHVRRDHRSQENWGATVLGIKTNVNITPFEALLRQRTTRLVERDALLSAFPAEEVAALLKAFDAQSSRHIQADEMESRKNARLPDGTCLHAAGKALCGRCMGPRRQGCTHMSGEGICRACLVRG
jgi:hypothetical protein